MASALQISAASVGWSGVYKLGKWTPLVVAFQVDEPVSGKLIISALDGEGIRCNTTIDAVRLSPTKTTVTAYVRLGINDQIRIRFTTQDAKEEADFVLDVSAPSVSAWQQLVVSIGSDIDVDQAMRSLRRTPEESAIGIRLEPSADLPDRWYGYDGVDAVFICTSDLRWWHSLSPAQKNALVEWVAHGGRVVVSMGRNTEELFSDSSPLAAWKPGQFLRLVNQRQTSALEELGETTARLDLLGQDAVGRFAGIPSAVFAAGDGVVDVEEGFGQEQSSWVIRRAYGLGIVKLLLTDIDQSPFDQWPATTRLVARLLEDLLPGKPSGRQEQGGRIEQSQLGYRDLTGQLRAAMEEFGGVRAAPFALIAGLAGVYVLLIGPIDFWVLRRFGNRLHWTWVTFPLLALVLCTSISFLARHWKGTSLVVNEVHLLDIGIDAGEYRGTSWTHVFTPRTEQISLAVSPHIQRVQRSAVNDGVLFSWQGLPGRGFGGMSAPTRYGGFLEPYQVYDPGVAAFPQTKIRELAMPKWSSRAFSANWWGRIDKPLAIGNVGVSRDGVLTGVLKNTTGITLRDCAVCFGRWYYSIGRLNPGEEFSFDGEKNQDLRSRLTRRVIFDNSKELNSPWDPESSDIGRIMEMLMFHDAAGGRETYTELLDRYDGNLDMSQLIQLRRAVLYGRTDDELCQINCDGVNNKNVRSNRQTFCRFVIPVSDSSADL